MSRSHVGRWTPLHKGLFAVAAGIAALGAAALLFSGDAKADSGVGVNTYIAGDCGVRIMHLTYDGTFDMRLQKWSITDGSRKVYAEGTNHIATVFLPEGKYYFNSGNFSQSNTVQGGCDGTVLYTFVVRDVK